MERQPDATAKKLIAHWRRGRSLAALVTLLFAVFITGAACKVQRADGLDSWWLRARFSLRGRLAPAVADPDIVLVEIDDSSLNTWPEPLIAWGGHLADAITHITAGGAKMIALDWIQPIPTDKWLKWDHDQRLGVALAAAPDVVTVEEYNPLGHGDSAYTKPTPELLYALPDAYLDGGAKHLGYAELSGSDSVVASVVPVLGAVNHATPGGAQSATPDNLPDSAISESFAVRIADRLGKHKLGIQDNVLSGLGRHDIPLRHDGSLLINYPNHVGSRLNDPFTHISLSRVAAGGPALAQAFRDKIVLIGATYHGCNDFHFVPFLDGARGSRKISGLEVQASLLRTLLDGDPIREPDTAVVWALSVALGSIGILCFVRFAWATAAAVSLAGAIAWLALAFGAFVAFNFALPISLPLGALVLCCAIMGGYRALGEERERAKVLSLWGRYQDPRLVQYFLEHPEFRGGEGREEQATVLFADLKNFTKTVESLTPSDAMQQLNRYLGLMQTVIQDEYGGVVDKFLGDGLMAQWGVPQVWSEVADRDHARSAVLACLELDKRIRSLTTQVAGNQDVTFGVRLTLHTGNVVAGWVGGTTRVEYTIIGDTVNVTSRLQESAKELDCEFLISQSTYELAGDLVNTGREVEVAIRGRKQPLRVYEVLAGIQAEAQAAAPVGKQL